MLNSSRKHVCLFGAARIMGCFPFVCKIRNNKISSCSKSAPRPGCRLELSYWWLGWSVIFTVLNTAIMVLDSYFAVSQPRQSTAKFHTLGVIHMMFDVTSDLTVIVVQIACVVNSVIIKHITQHLSDYSLATVWEGHMYVYMILMLVFTGSVLTASVLSGNALAPLIVVDYKITIIICLLIYIGLLYRNNLDYLKVKLLIIFEPYINEYKDIQIGKQHLCKNNFNRSMSREWGEKYNINSNIKTLKLKTSSGNNNLYCNFHNLRQKNISQELLDLFEIHKMVKDYVAVPIVCLMVALVIWLIISAFYVSLWNDLSWVSRWASLSHLAISLTAVCYFVDASSELKKNVNIIYCK